MIVVGGGFAGLGCARQLAKHHDVRVTLLDRNNYHQFQPLLYQVATSQLRPSEHRDVAAQDFRKRPNVDMKLAEVAVDRSRQAGTVTDDGRRDLGGRRGRARGRLAAELLRHARRGPQLVPALLAATMPSGCGRASSAVFEDADRDPSLIDRGALNFVVVGGGPTGVETAGALADMIRRTMTVEYRDLAVTRGAGAHRGPRSHAAGAVLGAARTTTSRRSCSARGSSCTWTPR